MTYKLGDKILYGKLTGTITKVNFPFITVAFDKNIDNVLLNLNRQDICDNLRKLTKLDKALK